MNANEAQAVNTLLDRLLSRGEAGYGGLVGDAAFLADQAHAALGHGWTGDQVVDAAFDELHPLGARSTPPPRRVREAR